jgi:hypothetical protein
MKITKADGSAKKSGKMFASTLLEARFAQRAKVHQGFRAEFACSVWYLRRRLLKLVV